MSNQADIFVRDKKIIVSGSLNFNTVMSVYKKSLNFLNKEKELNFDFSELGASDSSAIALLVEWIKWAKLYDKKIHFAHLPQNLLTVANIAGAAWIKDFI